MSDINPAIGGTIIAVEEDSVESEVVVRLDDGREITDSFGKIVMHQYADFGHTYGIYPSESAIGRRVVVHGNRYNPDHVVLSVPLTTVGGDTLVSEEEFESVLNNPPSAE